MPGYCPYCNAEWPAGATDCPKCGVLLDRWLKRRALDSTEVEGCASGAPRRAFRRPRWAGAALKGAGLLAAAAAAAAVGWRLLSPVKGLPVAGDVHVDPKAGFAVTAPAGFTAEWASAGSEASGERLLARLSGTYPNGFQPELSIAALPWPAVQVAHVREEDLVRDCFGRVRSAAGDWTPGNTRIEKVDLLESLRVDGSGSRRARGEAPAVVLTATYSVFAGGVLVPGRDRSYLLSYVCDKRDGACLSSFDRMVASFRVLKRPRPLDFLRG